jgi:hypothetical protein
VRHIVVIDDGVVGWQAARTCTHGRQVCGVPHVCGSSSFSGGRSTTDGDHGYASGSEPGLSTLGALSSSRGGCSTRAPCGIRFGGRKWRSSFAKHTNMLINGIGLSTLPTVTKLITLRPPLRPYSPCVPRALTLYLPPELALSSLHAPTVWPLTFFHWPLLTVLLLPSVAPRPCPLQTVVTPLCL